jgi:protein gp37
VVWKKTGTACAHCYAETFAKRTGWAIGAPSGKPQLWGKDSGRRFFSEKHWNEPLKWDSEAAVSARRSRVFCASMSDVFEDREDLVSHRARLFDLIRRTPNLDWLLLTKRPENVREHIRAAYLRGVAGMKRISCSVGGLRVNHQRTSGSEPQWRIRKWRTSASLHF